MSGNREPMVVNGKQDWFRKVEYQMSRLRSQEADKHNVRVRVKSGLGGRNEQFSSVPCRPEPEV